MPGPTQVAPQQVSITQDGPADPRAQGEQQHIAPAPRGSAPDFPEQGGLGVVQHRDRVTCAEVTRPIESLQPRQTARQVTDGAAVRGGQTGGGEADAERRSEIGVQAVHHRFHPCGPVRPFGTREATGQLGTIGRQGEGLDPGAPEIDADQIRWNAGAHGI